MAKKVRVEDADRISNLPDAIISHILSFLSTKEAFRTSILSTRWRYCFALVSNLDFELDDELLFPGEEHKKNLTIKSFESFVDRMLFFHNTSIEKFRLQCWDIDSSHVYSWISAAIWRGVQHLDLTLYKFNLVTLPGVLFTCRRLVTLKLEIARHFIVPNDVCFPNLKSLHLTPVKCLNDDSVKRPFSGCISLEDMILEEGVLDDKRVFKISHPLLNRLTIVGDEYYYNFTNNRIVIDAPMLVYFKYKEYQAARYSLKNLHSLVSADIDFVLEEDHFYSDHQPDAAPFFRGIQNVQSLNLSATSIKVLLRCEPLPVFPRMVKLKVLLRCKPVPVFPRMVKLKIYNTQLVSCYYGKKGLATLLRASPELEELAFFQEVFSYLPRKVPSCLLFKLKQIEIEILECRGGDGKECIGKAKYVLKNAGALKKLTIRASHLSEKERLKITKELLASPRKSEKCCILII